MITFESERYTADWRESDMSDYMDDRKEVVRAIAQAFHDRVDPYGGYRVCLEEAEERVQSMDIDVMREWAALLRDGIPCQYDVDLGTYYLGKN